MQHVPVVILNVGGAEVLTRCLLGGIEHVVIDARSLPRLSLRESRDLALRLIPRHMFAPTGLKGVARLRYLGGRFRRLRLLWRLRQIQPSVILTFVDNDYDFQWLSRRCPGRFIAVQNGVRAPYDVSAWLPPAPHPAAHISMPELVCFGAHEKDLYSRFGHAVDQYHCWGSVRAADYASRRAKTDAFQYELCIVSQRFAGFASPPKLLRELPRVLNALYEAAARYVREKNISACVAMRTNDDEERRYFMRIFEGRVDIIENDQAAYSTYAAIDRSNVSLAMDSTVAWEMFGLGAKILLCNLGADPNYDFPVPGIWALRQPDFAALSSRLDRLREMPQSEYLQASTLARDYVMHVDPQRPAHVILRESILSSIESAGGGAP